MSQNLPENPRRNPTIALGGALMLAIAIKVTATFLMGLTFYPEAVIPAGCIFMLGFILYCYGISGTLRTFIGLVTVLSGVSNALFTYYHYPLGIKGKVDQATYLWIHFEMHSQMYILSAAAIILGWTIGTWRPIPQPPQPIEIENEEVQ